MTRTRYLAAALAAFAGAPAAAADLTVFDWAGYEDPAFHPAYVEAHGESPDFAFFGDEDEAFQKLRSGFRADVAHPCSQSVVKWRDAGLLEPLDISRLTHWNDVLPGLSAMKDLMTSADGQAWFLPFEWGNTALIYRADRVPAGDVTSLQVFTDPKYEGRVSIGDNVDDAYALAGLAIGLKDLSAMTDAEFAAASDFLRRVHRNVRLYWLDNTEIAGAMASGEVDIAWAWNETAATLQGDGIDAAINRDTKEGLSTWVCGYVRLKDGEGDEAAVYDYLNAVSAPEVAPYMVEAWGYGHGNGKGMAMVPAEVLTASGYDDIDRFTANTLFQSPVPVALKQRMIEEFEKIKAGY